jgi:hypothetical protein
MYVPYTVITIRNFLGTHTPLLSIAPRVNENKQARRSDDDALYVAS